MPKRPNCPAKKEYTVILLSNKKINLGDIYGLWTVEVRSEFTALLTALRRRWWFILAEAAVTPDVVL